MRVHSPDGQEVYLAGRQDCAKTEQSLVAMRYYALALFGDMVIVK